DGARIAALFLAKRLSGHVFLPCTRIIVRRDIVGGNMERFWLKNYPPGVPAGIDPSVYPSVVSLLEESFAKYRGAKAYVCMDRAPTFEEVDRLSQALAVWLHSRGLGKGARVAIMMPNVLQYPVAVAAVLRAGFIAVNVNPLYTARELEHQLKDSGAEAVI